MKKYLLGSATAIIVLLLACSCQRSGTSSGQGGEYAIPAPGAIVTASSMPITDDPLNHFVFTVKVKATPNSKYGTYDVDATWGNNPANSSFTMPRGGEHLKPLIRNGADKYTYIIGFNYGSDKTFYDYYEVRGQKGQIKMKYVKAYSFK